MASSSFPRIKASPTACKNTCRAMVSIWRINIAARFDGAAFPDWPRGRTFFSQSAKDELYLSKTGACSIGFSTAGRYSQEKKTRVAGPRDPQAVGRLLTNLRSATSVEKSGSRPAQEPKPEKNAGGKGRSRRNKKYNNPLPVLALRVTEAP